MTATPEQIDAYLEAILRAAGSSLRHYMPSSKDDLRKAMADVLAKHSATATGSALHIVNRG